MQESCVSVDGDIRGEAFEWFFFSFFTTEVVFASTNLHLWVSTHGWVAQMPRGSLVYNSGFIVGGSLLVSKCEHLIRMSIVKASPGRYSGSVQPGGDSLGQPRIRWSGYKSFLARERLRISQEKKEVEHVDGKKGRLASCAVTAIQQRKWIDEHRGIIGLSNLPQFSPIYCICELIISHLHAKPIRVILSSSCPSLVIKFDPRWQHFLSLIKNNTSRLAVARCQRLWDDFQEPHVVCCGLMTVRSWGWQLHQALPPLPLPSPDLSLSTVWGTTEMMTGLVCAFSNLILPSFSTRVGGSDTTVYPPLPLTWQLFCKGGWKHCRAHDKGQALTLSNEHPHLWRCRHCSKWEDSVQIRSKPSV